MGLLGAFSAARFLAKGWVATLYLAPEHHLTYPWVPWIRPLPAPAMYAVVAAMIPLGLAVAAGRRTRLAAGLFVAAFTYCELIDAALYLNHYWFVTLTFALLVVLPTSGRRSIPVLVVWILRFQVGVVYVMAGLAKLNHDWLVDGQPMTTWLASRTAMPVFGGLLDRAVRRARRQLARRRLRPDDRRLVAVATLAPVRLRRPRGLPRGDLAAVRHRRVPLGDDRRHNDLLPARLAAHAPHSPPQSTDGCSGDRSVP